MALARQVLTESKFQIATVSYELEDTAKGSCGNVLLWGFLGLSKKSLEKGLSGTAWAEVVLSWEGVAGQAFPRALLALAFVSFCKQWWR